MKKKTFRDGVDAGVLYPGRRGAKGAAATTSSSSGGIAAATMKKRTIFSHLTRLHHGILRYKNVAESPTSVGADTQALSSQDRKFVYFPAGYTAQSDKCLEETLMALGLRSLPPLVVVTASTDGAVEEHLEEGTQEDNALGNPLKIDPLKDLDLTEDQERELLREKTHEILKSTAECCGEMGAWLLPHRPRRANGAAEVLCDVIPKDRAHTPVILGLIGLDKQDKESGLSEQIASNIYPVGSDIKKVIEISYDPNVRDNTPCPELTHLLIFQRRKEMREFREKLLSKIPELFVAFGNATSYAKNCMFTNLVNGSPIALITHTSKVVDNMALALRHADREMTKVNVGAMEPPQLGTSSHAVSGAETEFETFPLPPLPALEHDEVLSQFLSKWPANHDDERVVLADPRRVGGGLFRQQILRAIKAAFYTRKARIQALFEATTLLKSIQDSTLARNKITDRYHLEMVLATLTAVVAAVLYAKIYGADPPPSLQNRNPYQIGLFFVTIVIPFLIVSLKVSYDRHSKTWSVIQNDAAKLESAIFEFRARPRTFGQPTSSEDPLEAFIKTVLAIHTRNQPFMESEHITVASNISDHKMETNDGDAVPHAEDNANSDHDIEAPPANEASPLLPAIMTPPLLNDIQNVSTKWKKYAEIDLSDNFIDNYQEHFSDHADDEEDDSESNLCSPLSIKDYIVCRIQMQKDLKLDEMKTFEYRNKSIDTAIKVVLGCTTLLALASKQWFIPIVLGGSTALASSQEFRKYEKRMELGQHMVAQLDELLTWWQHLSVDEKILSQNQDRLVQEAERIIMADNAFTY